MSWEELSRVIAPRIVADAVRVSAALTELGVPHALVGGLAVDSTVEVVGDCDGGSMVRVLEAPGWYGSTENEGCVPKAQLGARAGSGRGGLIKRRARRVPSVVHCE